MESLKSNQAALQVDPNELELRERSKSWTPQEWETYLQTLETPLREDQISPYKYVRLAEKMENSIYDLSQSHARPALVARVQLGIDELTVRQRQVIELIFFKSKSTHEAALEIGISQSTVRDLKRKALKNLRRDLTGGTLNFPTSRRPVLKR